jgi:hypothetical protein
MRRKNMDNTIEYYKKDVFGTTHLYIKSKPQAQQIAVLLKKKTITRGEMNIMKLLFGVEFIQVFAPEGETPL